MWKDEDRYRYSPSDLLEFLSSPFASWMTRRWLDDPQAAQPDAESPQQLSLAEHGRRHEQAFLEQLRVQGRRVYSIPSDGDRVTHTLRAMQAGREVIFHGVLAQADFVGETDFLIRVESPSLLGGYSYEVYETKLARLVKPEFLIQLCGYADLLESVQGRAPSQLYCVLGNGQVCAFRTADYIYYYRALKRAFVAFLYDLTPDRPSPNPWGGNGRWQSHAEALLQASDHLCRVANITQAQVEKLQAAGIRTMHGLANTDLRHVARLDETVFAQLREQAQLQLASAGADVPAYRVVQPVHPGPRRGLALLPPESALDVYFDLEGYPLIEGGREYLFGASCVEHAKPRFFDWWAHDSEQEKRVFEAFVDWAFARWQADPGTHLYHYGHYEVAALRRLMGRYATREAEVDSLLQNGVFVDLYTIVRQGLRVGEPRYSIKNLERLFHAKRTGLVGTALDSVVAYERWLASGEPQDWRASPILQEIRAYNRDDCESVWRLAGWLRKRQREAGIVPPKAGRAEATDPGERVIHSNPRHELAERLFAAIPQQREERAQDEQRWQTQEILGQVVEFHRREEKPVWWATFERQAMTEQELIEDFDCLGGLHRAPEPPVPIKNSLGFWFVFDPDQDTKLTRDATCFFAHDLAVTTAIQELDRDAGRVCLRFGRNKLQQFADGRPPARLSLIPNEHVSARVIAEAIEHTARNWQESRHLSPALADFLARRPPRLHPPGEERAGIPRSLVAPGEDLQTAAVRLVSGLDHSSLCIQGPPGTGKTTVGAAMIVSLLQQGKRVGISSNSHDAILNLMQKCSELRNDGLNCIKVGGPQDAPFFTHCREARYVSSIRYALPELTQVGLIGGTAWAFSAASMRDKLDYLFVDEAGQVPLANLIAMSASAKNLVLLGDQMQLSQPIQGSHPGQSGQSALEYLLQGRATIPDTLGIFLDSSWRLHPRLCRFISDTMYDGRLQAAPHTKNRLVRVPAHGARYIHQEAGLVFVPVEHTGNTQASDGEVDLIRRIVHELVGRELTDKTGQSTGTVRLDDILLVAPYNMQVRKLKAALGPQARVGSVDKFQGQEAAVVIMSMCASHGEAPPRGIEFLFNRNRLNVALSRAYSLAIVVAHPGLSRTRCTTLGQMAAVNVFCRVVEEGGSARGA